MIEFLLSSIYITTDERGQQEEHNDQGAKSLIKSKLLSGREPAIWEMIWIIDPKTPLERQTIRRANNKDEV